jgi:hypothetical protein
MTDDARSALRAAWDDLLAELARARDAVDDPALMPPPSSSRNLAEGYRYLLGFVHGGIERAFFSDPVRPAFRHVLQILNKGTIDNADAIYFAAPIDGRHAYTLHGTVGDARHWRGEAPAATGRLAPRYLIFELTDGPLAGDTGSLAELRPGVKVQTGRIDSSALEVGPDGRFEILLAPERPPGHTGNFVATHRRVSRPPPDDPEGPLDRYAAWISGRQLFHDWEREDPAFLTVTRVEPPADPPPSYSPDAAARELRALGAMVRGQMHFWNRFYTELLETYGKRDGKEGPRFMPRNGFNAVNAASRETGGGQSTNLYAGGVFELEPDEALVIESRVAVEPQYLGIVLSNLWGESLDFANHQCSLNGFQSERDPDGALRWVIAHRDPGVPNWLDTTGHREGFISPRWTYSTPPPKESWPTIRATKIPFDRIREHLPEGTRRITPAERLARIRVRQEHVLRRYRAF